VSDTDGRSGNVTPWLKVRNPHYLQVVGRHEFFKAARSPTLLATACHR
jgi:hypothetical protein